MLNFTIGFLATFLITMLVVRYAHVHAKFTADLDLSGAQKFHTTPVPRIGGVGIMGALIVNCLVLWLARAFQANEYTLLVLAAMPAFVAGLAEDTTKRVTPRVRLIATMASAVIGIWLLDARVVRIDIGFVDRLLGFFLVSCAITAVAVAGLANAINIIDGFNGLASMVTMMMFMSLGFVAFHVGDPLVLSVALVMAGAILGFFLWNFPAGLIFLGDGGAYLIGFILGELAVMLVMRNPGVSAWYPVLMVIYPIFETLFSIYRKRFIRGISPGVPDGVHLHMLVYKRLMRWAVGSNNDRHRMRRNSFTSPYLWMLSLLAVIPATLFWNRGSVLIFFVGIFVLTYVWLYWSIVRFKVPRWMIVRKNK